MKYLDLRERLDDLENDVIEALKNEINESNLFSKFVSDAKVIKVNIFGYIELCLLDEYLVFYDSSGYQYGLFAECDIYDLINILNDL